MANEILVDIEEIQTLLNKMITCKDKTSTAGNDAKIAINGFRNEGVSSANSAYRAIVKADGALIRSLNSGISALNETIQRFKETEKSISKETNKIDSSQIKVPSPSGNIRSTSDENTQSSSSVVPYASNSYEEVEKKLSLVEGSVQIQSKWYPPEGKTHIGRCETVSLATLVRRRMVYDGKNPDELGYSVSKENYVSRNLFYTGQNEDVYDNKIPQAVNTILDQNKNSVPNKNKVYSGYTLRESNARSTNEIVALLQSHPEGIQVAMNYPKGSGPKQIYHKIVISDYTVKPDGSYQFYAYDGNSGNARLPLEETAIWSKKQNGWEQTGKSTESFFNNLEYVRYLE